MPGKRLSIKVEGAGNATVGVFMNTMRTGSTYLWDTDKYDRPRFIRSPDLGLQAGKSLSVVSPYGGPLQLSAQAQVQAYGFALQPAFFYANTTTNNLDTAKRLDMSQGSPAWPFP